MLCGGVKMRGRFEQLVPPVCGSFLRLCDEGSYLFRIHRTKRLHRIEGLIKNILVVDAGDHD